MLALVVMLMLVLVLNQPLSCEMLSGSASGAPVDLKGQMDPELEVPVRQKAQTFHFRFRCEITLMSPDVKLPVCPVGQFLPPVENPAVPDNLPDAPHQGSRRASDPSPGAGYP